jgi:hypothetical protein
VLGPKVAAVLTLSRKENLLALRQPLLPDGVSDRLPENRSNWCDSTRHTSGDATLVDNPEHRRSVAGRRPGDGE